MSTITFDTHESVKKLKAVGFTEEQAEVQTRIIGDLVTDQLSTKRDLKEMEGTLKRDIEELKLSTKRDLKELELSLTHKLTIRLGSMMVVGIVVVATLVKIL